MKKTIACVALLLALTHPCGAVPPPGQDARGETKAGSPPILLCLSDDQSYQRNNLAADPVYGATLRRLSDRLTAHLKATGDPRETTGDAPWDAWPYHGYNQWEVLPEPASNALIPGQTPRFDPASCTETQVIMHLGYD
jgi:hypothetical protein